MLRCLFHVHTRHSCDSLLAPARILARAREIGVDVLMVTDHNTLQGAQEARALACGNPRFVVPAGEYQTEKGDVIGLFLKDELRALRAEEVVREIHFQGGLAVLPHPYRGHDLDGEWLQGMDLVETYNSRCSQTENAQARELAKRLGRPALGGADAHCEGELEATLTEFDAPVPRDEAGLREILLRAPRAIRTRPTSRAYRPASQIIKALRTRNLHLFVSQVRRWISIVAREQWEQPHWGFELKQR